MVDMLANFLRSKVFKKICDVLVTLVIIMTIIITLISFNSNSKGISNIFGYIPLSIQSSSMEGTFSKGDLIISKEVTDYDALKVGDVISFFSHEQDMTIIKTHRIIDIYEEEGFPIYVTKGDANENKDDVTVAQANIISIYTGTRIPVLGSIITFLQTSFGFVLCIIFPLLVLFLYSLYNFVVLIIENKKKEMYEQFKREHKIENKSNSTVSRDDIADDEFELPKMKG